MKNPSINRMIGYAILFISFYLWYKGFHYDGISEKNNLLIGLAAVVTIVSFVWLLVKVRCPHCHKLLHIKLYDISVCQHCGKETDK